MSGKNRKKMAGALLTALFVLTGVFAAGAILTKPADQGSQQTLEQEKDAPSDEGIGSVPAVEQPASPKGVSDEFGNSELDGDGKEQEDGSDNGANDSDDSIKFVYTSGITESQAKNIALKAAEGNVTGVEMDNESGNLVVSVKVTKDGLETDVKIDPASGNVIRIESDQNEEDADSQETADNEQENADESQDNATDKEEKNEESNDEDTADYTPSEGITKEQAIDIALKAVDGIFTQFEVDNARGTRVISVEVTKDGVEKDVKIDPQTGKVLKVEGTEE